MKKKILLVIGMLAVLSLMLAACAPADTGSTVETKIVQQTVVIDATPQPDISGDITIWVMPNGPDPQKHIDDELLTFQAMYPNIKVTAEVVGWGDAYTRITTAVQGGEGPCVTQMGSTWVGSFGAMGGLHEFTAEEVAEVGGEAAFVPASWQTGLSDGKLVAMPWVGDVRALYYNKKVYEAAGVDVSTAFATLDSYIAALEKIRDAKIPVDPEDPSKGYVAPLVHPGKGDWNVWQNQLQWIWAYGGDILNEDMTKAVFNSEAALDAVMLYTSLYSRGLTSSDNLEMNSATTDERLGKGLAATELAGPYVIPNIRDAAVSGYTVPEEDFGVAEFPAGPGGQYTFIGGSDLGIMNTCQDFDAAWALVKYLLRKDAQIRYGNAIGLLPVTYEALEPFKADPFFAPFIAAADKGKTSAPTGKWGAIETAINTAFTGIWEDVAEACLKQGDAACAAPSRDAVKARLDAAASTVDELLAG
ncbi:MAG: extracellular solute-binding protein [Anaerolineales bacterium]|nr:extracellular solute-binding protein [Anaerolineales bacterium]